MSQRFVDSPTISHLCANQTGSFDVRRRLFLPNSNDIGMKLFCVLDSNRMAGVIRTADTRVCYVAPGIQVNVANAIIESAKRSPNIELTVSIDFDERVMRMGYGHIEGVRILRDAGVEVRHSPGFRSAVLIADDWVGSSPPQRCIWKESRKAKRRQMH